MTMRPFSVGLTFLSQKGAGNPSMNVPNFCEPFVISSKRTTRLLAAASARVGIPAAVFLLAIAASGVAAAQTTKTFIDYLKPTPITCSALSSATWGVAGVLPRDLCNGIESAKGAAVPPDYYY